jgi:hypothetical protein
VSRIEVIGLSGKAGAGKDWVGREVLRPLGYMQWAYAWPIKTQMVGRGESFEDVMVNKPPRVRELLQVVGTEQGRDVFGQGYWIRQFGAWLRILHEELGLRKFYVTDVRFPNEVEAIQELGGKVVRLVHGPGLTYPLAGTPAENHSSETALDKYTRFDGAVRNHTGITPAMMHDYLRVQGILPPVGDPTQLRLI